MYAQRKTMFLLLQFYFCANYKNSFISQTPYSLQYANTGTVNDVHRSGLIDIIYDDGDEESNIEASAVYYQSLP